VLIKLNIADVLSHEQYYPAKCLFSNVNRHRAWCARSVLASKFNRACKRLASKHKHKIANVNHCPLFDDLVSAGEH